MNKGSKILVVDDDPKILQMVVKILERGNYKVTTAAKYDLAINYLESTKYDLLLTDLVLPDGDGLELIRKIRAHDDIPIIIISGLGETTERIVGLEMGADDYISKPFDPRELLARIKSVLNRYTKKEQSSLSHEKKLSFEGWTLDIETRKLIDKDNQEVEITSGEFDLLRVLASNTGRALSREQLMDYIYGHATPAFDRTIDVRIGRLRKKIEPDAKKPSIIKTVRSIGYSFGAKVIKSE